MSNFRMMLAGLALFVGASRLEAQQYVVVVNAANPVTALTRDRANGIFLKRVTRWDDGSPILPVYLERTSDTREELTRAVHGKSVGAIESTWQQQIFAGKEAPPQQRASEADVLAFVRANPGAIGYVSAAARLGEDVKAIPIN